MRSPLLLSIFVFTTLSFSGIAQTESPIKIKTDWSEKQNLSAKQKRMTFDFIGNNGEYEYLNNGLYSEYLYRYNLSTQKIETLELDLTTGDNERFPEFTIMLNGEVHIFSSFQNKKQKKHYLFVQTLDKEKFELNPPKKIAELNYEGESNRRPATFNYALSPDKSKLLIYYSVVNKDNEILRSGFNVYDNKCNELQKYGNIRSGVSDMFSFGQYAVDNLGNVFVEGRSYTDTKEMNSNPERGKSYVIIYSKENPEPKPIAVTFPESKYPVGRKLGVNNKSELIYAGIFSQEGMKNGIGVFSTKISPENQTSTSVKLYNFDFKYLTKGMNESDQESMKKSMAKGNDFEKHYCELQDIKLMDNGTFTLIGEKKYTIVYYNSKTGNSYTYYFGDIMAANFKDDASVNWMQKIPREIHYDVYRPGVCGIIYDKNNTVKVFYNYDKINILGGFNPKNGNFIMVNFDENGNETYKEIKTAREDKHIVFPSVIDQLNSNEILLFGSRGYTNPAFLKLTLED